MAPPGDVRRCLVTLSTQPELALAFEERLHGGVDEGRCVGNLVLAEMTRDLGSFQRAVDWAASLLSCEGRVIPASEAAATLSVYDLVHGQLSGESRIEALSGSAVVAAVEGEERANPEALRAIASADLLFMGPGSFVGSTLAVLLTGDVARAVVQAKGRRAWIRNVRSEERTGFPGAVAFDDHERMLRDHLVIGSGGDPVSFDVVEEAAELGWSSNEDGSRTIRGPIASDDKRRHDAERLASVLASGFGLARRSSPAPQTIGGEARQIFDAYLASARARLRSPPGALAAAQKVVGS